MGNMDRETQRILIADDEEAVLFSYQRLLKGRWIEVDTCANLETAIAMIKACANLETAIAMIKANNYSAVVSDIRFSPWEDAEGLEVLRQVRKHRPATPVILMTAFGNDEVREKALALGVAAFLDKPVLAATLFARLKEQGILVGES
jgi:DNA-binding NtrC family response regulator